MDLDPKNVLSPAGQCQFNEVVSVVMVRAENHLATSYPCHGRGLLSTSWKKPTGNITPRVSDSVPALSFYNKRSVFKGFNTFFMEHRCFFFCFFLKSHGRHVPVTFASAETAQRNKSTERGDECHFGEPPSRVDELICVVPGGPTLRFPRITGRNEQRSVTAHISYAAGGPHITSPLRKKATRNVSRTPECPLVRYHHPRAEVM